MTYWLQHLPILPIIVPLIAGAIILLLPEARRRARATIAVVSTVIQLAAALGLLYLASDAAADVWVQGIGVYAIGNWQGPFGIVLVVDRLAAVMVTLSSCVALAALVYSFANWDRPGQAYHALFQFLLMGLHGAFLTGDIFNLFVFFEVLLAASYGLVLRGAAARRVKAGMHYIVVNLVASFLFLIGVALMYGVAGTLNMADLTGQVAALSPDDRTLFEVGAAILGVAFLIKAGSWPLNLWLPDTYSAAIAPVAAAFAMLTKVGVYAVMRIGTLMSMEEAAASMLGPAFFYIGMGTLVAGSIGMLAAQQLARVVSYSLIVSTGIMLAALGLGTEAVTAPVLFYLIASVLTSAAFFLLTGVTERTRQFGSTEVAVQAPDPTPPRPHYVAFGVREPDPYSTEDEVGVAIPAAMAFLGLVFVCCVLLVAGLPPLPGFVAKLAVLVSAIGSAPATDMVTHAWVLTAAVLATGIVSVIALTRIGMNLFWAASERTPPRLRMLEAVPLGALVVVALALGAAASPVMTYLEATARSLHEPQTYIDSVLVLRPQIDEGAP